MYSKQDLINSIGKEIAIIKHLFTKIPEGGHGFKFTEKQRTTLELLQYLSVVGSAGARMVVENDTTVFGPYMEQSKATTMENFIEAMDKQDADLKEYLGALTDETLKEEVDLFNMGKNSKGVYLVETVLKWLAAYRTQLFLQVKGAGNHAIGTSNLWGGMDMPAAA